MTLPKAGRYELLEELGQGAMGVVYKAHDPVIGRNVAVKTLRLSEQGTGMSRTELVARFRTEARAAGLLTHPNIVVVYDAGEDEGLFYITMEYVDGRSLQSLFDAKQSFPLPRVLRMMEQACSALEYAHQRNVVHRDIKPANLMLTPDDTVKITDFGTAKILQFGTTETAHIIGTPSYMSPEQVKGKPVDGRADIFAMGVILYELVTGEKPFPGENVTTVIYKIVHEDPTPPRELDAAVHPGLSRVILRALAKDPDGRFQSCRELMDALASYRGFSRGPETTQISPATASSGTAGEAEGRAIEAPLIGATLSAGARTKRAAGTLALVLLAIIVGAGYRVWPYMREVWNRVRPAAAAHAPDESAGSQPAAPSSASAKARPDEPANKVAGPMPSVGGSTWKSPPPRAELPAGAPSGLLVDPRVADLQARMEHGLALVGLGDKVKVHAAGNTLTLSGSLNPREHRQLLHRLRNAPSWVRIVDHIEYADKNPNQARRGGDDQPQPAPGRGEVAVLTDVLGASAVLRGSRGQHIKDCRTPCRFEDLRPGRYVLEINLAGYRPSQRIVQVGAGSVVDERIELESMAAGLYVTSRPEDAEVLINGERQPKPTPTTIRLGPGTYRIEVRKPGFEAYSGQVHLKDSELMQVDVTLAPVRQP